MSPRTVILASPDPVTVALIARGVRSIPRESYALLADRSMTIAKIWHLLSRRRVTAGWLGAQWLLRRRQLRALPSPELGFDADIASNDALIEWIAGSPSIKRLVAFRASLILSPNVISRVPCFNLHCARLPEYAGLSAIARALRARDLDQVASLHLMDTRVDAGEVIETEPFSLDPDLSHWRNDLEAYLAGTRLLARFLLSPDSYRQRRFA